MPDVKKLVTGVIGEDVHITGLRILEHALRNAGFEVISLGIHNCQDDFVTAALKSQASAILISSLCGHASILVNGIRQKCIEAGLDDILLYLGGHLSIHEEEWECVEKRFRDMGFDRVYRPFTLPEKPISDLITDFYQGAVL